MAANQIRFNISTGQIEVFPPSGGGGGGTVTSVGLSLPGIFSVAGSPVTTTGTLAATLATQAINLVWAGPATGSNAAPTFRSLVANDIPSLPANKIPLATTSADGYLSQTDWNTFNNKQDLITTGTLSSATSGVTVTGGANAVLGGGTSITIATASNSQAGLLSAADHTSFAAKQNALSFGDVTTSTSGISFTGETGAVVGTGLTIDIATATSGQDGLLSSSDWTVFNNKLDLAGGTMTGFLNLVGDAVSGNQAVTYNQFINGISGLSWKNSVRNATTTTLPSYTYYNGPSNDGAGATLTATTNGALGPIDTITDVVGDRILIKDEVGGNAPYNGIYTVTAVGSVSTPWILTRATDNDIATEMRSATTQVSRGTQAQNIFTQNTASVVMGTSPIAWISIFANALTATGLGVQITTGVISLLYDNSTIGINGSNQLYVPNGGILNAQVGNSAAIARSKLASGSANRLVINNGSGVMADAAAITAARVLISDANGIPIASSVTSATLAFLDATSSIQTQLNGKASLSGATFTGPVVEATNTPVSSSTMTVDTTLANNFILNLTSPTTTLVFTGSSNFEMIRLKVIQGTGNNLVTWPSNVKFGTDITSALLSTVSGTHDYVGLIYDNINSKFDIVSIMRGF